VAVLKWVIPHGAVAVLKRGASPGPGLGVGRTVARTRVLDAHSASHLISASAVEGQAVTCAIDGLKQAARFGPRSLAAVAEFAFGGPILPLTVLESAIG